MNTRYIRLTSILLFIALLLAVIPAASAQQPTNLAYVNAGGQLVITDSNAASRWVVTNPGEPLAANINLAWSSDGTRLFFGVQTDGATSLRVAVPASKSVGELALVGGVPVGGEWFPNRNAVLVGLSEGIHRLGDGGANQLIPGGQITKGDTISPDGQYLFYYQGGGFAVNTQNASNEIRLPGRNNATAAEVGLWAQNAPFVAHWGFSDAGTSALVVTNAASGESAVIDSGSSVPVTPLVWQQETLLFRSAVGVQAVDVACLSGGCANTPAATTILPVNAANVSISDSGVLAYDQGGQVFAVSAGCISSGDCASNAVNLGSTTNATLSVMNNTAAFTSSSGTIHAVRLGCVSSGSCTATNTGVPGHLRTFAPNGEQVLAFNGSQLQIINLSNLTASVIIEGVSSNSQVAWGT